MRAAWGYTQPDNSGDEEMTGWNAVAYEPCVYAWDGKTSYYSISGDYVANPSCTIHKWDVVIGRDLVNSPPCPHTMRIIDIVTWSREWQGEWSRCAQLTIKDQPRLSPTEQHCMTVLVVLHRRLHPDPKILEPSAAPELLVLQAVSSPRPFTFQMPIVDPKPQRQARQRAAVTSVSTKKRVTSPNMPCLYECMEPTGCANHLMCTYKHAQISKRECMRQWRGRLYRLELAGKAYQSDCTKGIYCIQNKWKVCSFRHPIK